MGVAKSNIGLISKIVLAIALLASVYGCGGGGSSGGGSTFTFNVVNNSSTTVNEFYLSPTSDAFWGPDRFSTDLLPGNTRSITGVAPCGVSFDYYAINGTFASPVVVWGPGSSMMPPCGGTFTLTLN